MCPSPGEGNSEDHSVPVTEAGPRTLGLLEGRIRVADDWDSDEVNEEIARLLEGGDD